LTDMSIDEYQLLVRKLPEADGGGYFAEAIDIPGCGVDGATAEEAVANCREALAMVLKSYKERGKALPTPGSYSEENYSGRFLLRIPRSLHQRLTLRARSEGISLNHLCSALLAESFIARAEERTERLTLDVLDWLTSLDERGDEVEWRLPHTKVAGFGLQKSGSRSTPSRSRTKS